MDKKITLRMLEAFRAVMQAKTITAAANVLNVSQPVVSRLIKDLEEKLGFLLFIRESGRLKPTREAMALFNEVRRSLEGFDHITRRAEMLRDGHQGYLQVVAAPAITLSLLPKVVTQFSQRFPRAHLSVQMHGSDHALDMVLNGLCDIALVMLSLHETGKYGQRISSGRMVCAVPIGHQLTTKKVVTPEDLYDEDFISHPPVLDTRLHIDQVFAARGIKRRMKLETQISHSLINFVAAGAGIALVDPLTASLHKESSVVFIPFDPIVINHYSVVTSLERTPSVLQKEFIQHLKKALRDSIAPEYRIIV